MALTDKQIDHLFEFTKKKFVHYYDLQIELVDHLAASIEEEMEKNPKLSFEDALPKVYKGFGIFGFAKVVQEKEAALRRQGKKMWLRELKSLVTLPKIFMTGALFALSLLLARFIPAEVRGIVIICFWVSFMLIEGYYFIKWNRSMKKKLLYTQSINLASFSNFFIPYWFFLPVGEIVYPIVFAIWITGIFILEMSVIEVNKKARQNAMELYPEAFA